MQGNSYSQLRESGRDYDSAPDRYRSGDVHEVDLATRSAFVEGDRFQAFIAVVILLNVVVLWGETDAPGLLIWTICDHLFLVIFIAEMALKLLHHKPAAYFSGAERSWAFLDVTIIFFGIGDLWLGPLILPTSSRGGVYASCLRIMRLMRLLRLLRVFKIFGELRRFLEAILGMGTQFIWIFMVLALFLVCTAIITTHLLGHGEALGSRHYLETEHADAFQRITTCFGDVATSIFTLFQLTTTDNWDEIAFPIISVDTRWRLFFYGFIVFASWTMISVLTAVASNSMIEATSDRKEKELEELERNHLMFIEFLRETFVEADTDGNEMLDKEEFAALMEKDFVHQRMKELGVHLTEEELFQAWDMLDVDESGELTIDEFVTGLSYLQESLATKHIVNADYSLKRAHVRIEHRMEKIRGLMTEVMMQNEEILQKLKSQDHPHRQQQVSLFLWQQWALQHEFNSYAQARMPKEKLNPREALGADG